jgi:hypothetical protein
MRSSRAGSSSKRIDRAREGRGIVGRDDEAGFSGDEVFARPAAIGNHDGQSAGLGFEDNIAEGVRGAGEDEEVGGGEGPGERRSAKIAGEDDGQFPGALRAFRQVGAVADDDELDAAAARGDGRERPRPAAGDFFMGDAADIEQSRGGAKGVSQDFGIPIGIAVARVEALDIDAAGVELTFSGRMPRRTS